MPGKKAPTEEFGSSQAGGNTSEAPGRQQVAICCKSNGASNSSKRDQAIPVDDTPNEPSEPKRKRIVVVSTSDLAKLLVFYMA